MSIEENLIARISQTDKISSLEKELMAALELAKNYEATIHELKLENNRNFNKLIHDLSNPLQVLSMTIEAAQDHPPKDLAHTLERMRRAAESMTATIYANRKLRAAANQSPANAGIKVV